MSVFTMRRSGLRGKPGRAGGPNLWRQWVRDPRAVRWLVRDGDVLGPRDIDVVEGWADAQSEWGLHVRLHDGVAGSPQVVEVFGPDLVEPHVLVYRVEDGFQVDEAHGASRCFAGMAEALDFVAEHT